MAIKLGSNKSVIELLESYLHAAQNDPFGAIGIVMVGYPNIAAIDWSGEIRLETMMQEGVEKLSERLKKSIDGWEFPERDETLDASFVRYNLAWGPVGFDFVTWLVRNEMIRVKEGAPGPLKVAFWSGKDASNSQNLMQQRNRQEWLDNVFRPCLKFIGAVEVERALYGRSELQFVPKGMVEDAKKGIPVPKLKPPHGGVTDAITITMREKQSGDIYRNSNVDGWIRFAESLQRDGEQVIVIRDTEKADDPIRGIHTFPAASRDLTCRMSVYGAAKMNFFVENGPSALCEYSDMPWMKFWKVNEETRLRSASFIETAFGINVGEQFPWSKENQKIVWSADSYDNIMDAWERLQTEKPKCLAA